jgi:chromosomal replication initiator protein
MPLAQEVLRDVLRQENEPVTIEMMQKFVAEYYQLKMVGVKSRNNSKSVGHAACRSRCICARRSPTRHCGDRKKFWRQASLPTVIHSVRKVEELRQKDSSFNSLINTPHRVDSLLIFEVSGAPFEISTITLCGRL